MRCGAPVMYGSIYLVLGLLFAPGVGDVVAIFPMPILGVVLFLEAWGLARLTRDAFGGWRDAVVAVAVVAMILFAPGGYATALVGGVVLAWVVRRSRAPMA